MRDPVARLLATRTIVLWAAAGYLATAVVAALVAAGSRPAYGANVVQLVMTVPLVVVCVVRGGRRTADRTWPVLPWRLLAAGFGLYLLGLLAFNVTYVAGTRPTSPTVWDAAYLAALPCFAAGLLALPRHDGSVRRLPLLAADALMTAAGLLAGAWALWVGRRLGGAEWSAGYLVGAGYIVLDLALLGVALVLLARARGAGQAALAWLTIAFAILAVTDLVATANGFGDLMLDDDWLYVGFTLVGVPLNTAVLLAARNPRRALLADRRPGTRDLFPPAVIAGGSVVALAVPGQLPVPLIVGMLAIAALREVLLQRERTATARRRRREVSMVRERVQRDLAGVLHDDVLGDLALLRWDLDDLAEQGDSVALRHAQLNLQATVDAVRGLVSENHPAVLAVPRLDRALDEMLARERRHEGPDLTLTVDPAAAGPAPPVLVTVTRELVRNAVRHAEARHVAVCVSRDDGSTVVRVVDDGHGIPPGRRDAALLGGHVGLSSSASRIEDAGGTFELRTGLGTTVTVTLPASRRPDG